MKALVEIKSQVTQLARQINVPENLMPTFGSSADAWGPHIDKRGDEYHYSIMERGKEYSHQTTTDADELLYWTFRDITSQMGYTYEHNHPDSTKDFRRIAFGHMLELLGMLNSSWKSRREAELVETIEKFPFQDDLHI